MNKPTMNESIPQTELQFVDSTQKCKSTSDFFPRLTTEAQKSCFRLICPIPCTNVDWVNNVEGDDEYV